MTAASHLGAAEPVVRKHHEVAPEHLHILVPIGALAALGRGEENLYQRRGNDIDFIPAGTRRRGGRQGCGRRPPFALFVRLFGFIRCDVD